MDAPKNAVSDLNPSLGSEHLSAECERLRKALQTEAAARADAEQARDSFRKLYENLLLELERLKRQLFGQKAEHVDPRQAQLAFGSVLNALARAREGEPGARELVEAELQKLRQRAQQNSGEEKKKSKTPHGRRDLSLENLPVETVVLEPPERKLPGGELLVKIGEESSEQIEWRKGSLVRVRTVRPKYKVPESLTASTTRPAIVPNAPMPAAGPANACHGLASEGERVVPQAPAGTLAPQPQGESRLPSESCLGERVSLAPEPMVEVPLERAPSEMPSPTPGSILIAALPDRPIPRSIAGPGLLARVLVQKYEDHIPLHRQERIFKRDGIHLPRSTLCGWVEGCTELLSTIVDAMWKDAIENAAWMAADATGVLVLAAERCKRGHFYVVIAERRHVLFRYTATNNGQTVKSMLAGFNGTLIADASTVYHELFRQENGGPTEAGCWSHGRRNFFDAIPTDRERALVAIGFIGLLYDAHWAATDPRTGLTDGVERKRMAGPILDQLYAWIAAERPKVADGSPIAKAMNYLVNQRTALERFLDDGRLRLDNNISELQLRHQKVGAKNWLFCGSENGARWNTTAVSLIASCKLHGIEPWAYLRDVLTILPSWKKSHVLELAPHAWHQTRQKAHAQELLASLRPPGHSDAHHAGKDSASG